jgi:hypothetical protein
MISRTRYNLISASVVTVHRHAQVVPSTGERPRAGAIHSFCARSQSVSLSSSGSTRPMPPTAACQHTLFSRSTLIAGASSGCKRAAKNTRIYIIDVSSPDAYDKNREKRDDARSTS